MNTESVERLSMLVWLAIAVWLGILAFYSRRFKEVYILRAVLWGAFIIFALIWIPVGSFGVIAVPVSFSFVENLVAFPFHDGSARFYGVSRIPASEFALGCSLVAGYSMSAIFALSWCAKKKKEREAA